MQLSAVNNVKKNTKGTFFNFYHLICFELNTYKIFLKKKVSTIFASANNSKFYLYDLFLQLKNDLASIINK